MVDTSSTWAVFAQSPSPLFRTLVGPVWLGGNVTLLYGANAFDGRVAKIVQYQRNAVIVEVVGTPRGLQIRSIKVWVRVLHSHLLQSTDWTQRLLNLLNLKFRRTVSNTITPDMPCKFDFVPVCRYSHTVC